MAVDSLKHISASRGSQTGEAGRSLSLLKLCVINESVGKAAQFIMNVTFTMYICL